MEEFYNKKSFTSFCLCRQDRYSQGIKALLENLDKAFEIPADKLLKNGNSATVVRCKSREYDLVIKRYNMKTMFHAARRAFKKSRADHSFCHAHILLDKGINTPVPVAMKEKRFGPFRNKAYFICEYIDGPTALDFFQDNNNDDGQGFSDMAEQITDMFRLLKSSMISHGDMKATNIIIHNRKPFLLDLDSMVLHKGVQGFKRAWKKDMKRFMLNWASMPHVSELFKTLENQ